MISESERLEQLAERLRMVQLVAPSPAAKIRGWNVVLAQVEKSAAHTRPRTWPRIVLALVAVVVVLSSAVAVSADSLPDSPLYAVKRLVENIRGALTFSPSAQFAFHLGLAMTRLREGEAMIASHRDDLADQDFVGLDNELNGAAMVVQRVAHSDVPAAAEWRAQLAMAVANDDRQLFELQAEVTDAAAIAAITRARAGAQHALLTAAQTATPRASP